MAATGRVVQGNAVEGHAPRYVQATVVHQGPQGNAWTHPNAAQGSMPYTPQPYGDAGACGAPVVVGTPMVGSSTRVHPQGLSYAPAHHRPMGMEASQSHVYAGGYGYGHGGFDEQADPPTCLAVLACLCCCPIVGICAILKAFEVSSANARGDYHLGHIKRKEAMLWIYMTVCIGMAVYVVNVAVGSQG